MALRIFSRKKKAKTAPQPAPASERPVDPAPAPKKTNAKRKPRHADYQPATVEPFDPDPLKAMFQQGRHSMILRERDRWQDHTEAEIIFDQAAAYLEQQMAMVPEGLVVLPQSISAQAGGAEVEEDVAPFLLDIHTVTNERYQHFVDAGGYDALDYWPEDIWPHIIELKDLTGCPGPRFWRNGRHDVRLADHPVVGISWFEAQAFALWIGQKLPTEAEWQMAASWSIKSSADILRRFPWGDAMDNTRCNIWSSRIGATVPSNAFPTGAAPNQILQLVGNVWEWTDTEFLVNDDEAGRPIIGEMPMHVIRGSSFDSYFESQATSHFRTGQIALARSHNTGFRCAMDLSQADWMNE